MSARRPCKDCGAILPASFYSRGPERCEPCRSQRERKLKAERNRRYLAQPGRRERQIEQMRAWRARVKAETAELERRLGEQRV